MKRSDVIDVIWGCIAVLLFCAAIGGALLLGGCAVSPEPEPIDTKIGTPCEHTKPIEADVSTEQCSAKTVKGDENGNS